ncbi:MULTISPECIES: hypothetical protein [Streptomyces]|uniref:Secreted protein n=1 Tax=Streptomyces morookaense TaxID=1970 RepID=A0A7Y7B274_STRMO|nr:MULTISPECIES: hypothetical protein [Streptomyces]MCC2275897.1 hypothetical protein [Streptomyces sp. ET3-23]NVK77629.1 hypothetical protein [Streptomyces morookaense]GHF05711.1 hypothetical protein GCM10010359_03400 [Streptomyces morookaense]
MFGRHGVRISLCAMALSVASLGLAPAAQAHAHAPLSCSGEESTSYTPGLTLEPRDVAIAAHPAYTCTDRPGHEVSATGTIEGSSPGASCLALVSAGGREVVHYAGGGESVIRYTSAFGTRALGVYTLRLQGTVTEGLGKGHRAVRSIQTLPGALPTDCLTSEGLRQAFAGVELEIDPS